MKEQELQKQEQVGFVIAGAVLGLHFRQGEDCR